MPIRTPSEAQHAVDDDSVMPVRHLAIVLIAEATQVEQPRPVLVHVHPPVQSTSVYAGPNLPVNRAEHAQANGLVVTFPAYRGVTGVLDAAGNSALVEPGQSAPPLSCNPTTPARTSTIDTSFSTVTDSFNQIMPTTTVPAAPNPVHTA
jgi:hypothetical protein